MTPTPPTNEPDDSLEQPSPLKVVPSYATNSTVTNEPGREVRGLLVPANIPAEWDHVRLSLPFDHFSRKRIVEQMARAIWDNTEPIYPYPFDKLTQTHQESYLNKARAALAAIAPKEPQP